MELQEGDIVLGTVDRIVRTTVFVRIPLNGKEIEGSMIFSEVAPGRIRNIRDYVVPKKKIAVKILRMSGDRVDLSLRRVSLKEQKQVMEQFKQEKSYKAILKTILKDKTKNIIEKIEQTENIYDFLEQSKESSKKLEKIAGKKEAEQILEILNKQKKKTAIITKEFTLTTTQPNGLELIKNILSKISDADVRYISAGKYSIKTEAENPKDADNKIKSILEQIEKQAKKDKLDFEVAEK